MGVLGVIPSIFQIKAFMSSCLEQGLIDLDATNYNVLVSSFSHKGKLGTQNFLDGLRDLEEKKCQLDRLLHYKMRSNCLPFPRKADYYPS